MLYLISYDLIGATRDEYDKLIQTLTSLGAQPPLESQWIIRHAGPDARTLGAQIRQLFNFGRGDRLLVTNLETFDGAGRNLISNGDVFERL